MSTGMVPLLKSEPSVSNVCIISSLQQSRTCSFNSTALVAGRKVTWEHYDCCAIPRCKFSMRSRDMVPDAILHLHFVLPVVREVVGHEGHEAKLASAYEGEEVPTPRPKPQSRQTYVLDRRTRKRNSKTYTISAT